jgi:hypothetical protein
MINIILNTVGLILAIIGILVIFSVISTFI